MGKKSTKDNKSEYQLEREALGLSREAAADLMPGMSPERIERIENNKVAITPEDIVMMSEAYKSPSLLRHYCTNECAIGKLITDEVKPKELGQIAIETINALNSLEVEKNRLLQIVEDGMVTEDEYQDFCTIRRTLEKMAASIDSLELWIDEKIADGSIDKSKL